MSPAPDSNASDSKDQPFDFGPLLAELLSKGCTISGDTIVEISFRSASGRTLLMELPVDESKKAELSPSVKRYCEKIKKYLAACDYPARTRDLELALYRGQRGGQFGAALTYMRAVGEIFTREGLNSDDPAKFHLDTEAES